MFVTVGNYVCSVRYPMIQCKELEEVSISRIDSLTNTKIDNTYMDDYYDNHDNNKSS